ncbi:MAG: alpha-L-rhamnosidase C-terminal domain-containing protein, partial [Monoglobaceae bacterium]
KELNGSIRIITNYIEEDDTAEIHVTLGESVSEALSDLGDKNSCNDHMPRDIKLIVSRMGTVEYGESGFRFVKIQAPDDRTIVIQKVHAVYIHDSAALKGSFECDDELLNQIWNVGAYTVYQNMQNYLLDGIKRDRLVWIGDMHPETSVILCTYGYNECIPRSLDLTKNNTRLDEWMNRIATYSIWWIINHYELYMYNGDVGYLKEQQEYLKKLTERAISWADDGFEGEEDMECFVDWSSKNSPGEIEGVKSIFAIGLRCAAFLFDVLGDNEFANKCIRASKEIICKSASVEINKGVAALNVLADRYTDKEIAILKGDSAEGMSCFMGYYVLLAKAKLGETDEAVKVIKEYWGGMLAMGATTFWEDFDTAWMENSFGIDSMPVEGKKDIHGDFGRYCYKNFRHSLCHGWASGPTAFMSRYILGVNILEPGCKKIQIKPNMCGLKSVKGDYPTPYGVIHIVHEYDFSGKLISKIDAPEEIEIIELGNEIHCYA